MGRPQTPMRAALRRRFAPTRLHDASSAVPIYTLRCESSVHTLIPWRNSSSTRCWQATSCALLLALLSSAPNAQGEPAQSESGKARPEQSTEPLIVLMLDPAQPDSRVLADAIGSHLAGLPIRLVRQDVARTRLSTWLEQGRQRAQTLGALGLFVIDVRSDQSSRLFLLEPNGEPTLIRRLPARRQSERVLLEEAGITVALLVEALLDGRHIGMLEPVPVDDAPPTVEPGEVNDIERPPPPIALQPAAAPTRSRRPQATLGLGLAGTTWLVDERWQLGVTTSLGVQFDSHWALALRYTWYPELTYELAGSDIALARHPVRAELAYRFSQELSPTARLGGWVDAVSRRTVATEPAYSAAAADTTWSWGFVGAAGLATPLRGALRAHFDVGLEVPTRRVEYAIQVETRRTLLATRSIRPVFEVALEMGF